MAELLDIASARGTGTATPSQGKPPAGDLAGHEPVGVTGFVRYGERYEVTEPSRKLGRLPWNQLNATEARLRTARYDLRLPSERAREASWLPECDRELEELLRLEQDWDSYGAEPPNDLAVSLAKKLVRVLGQQGLPPPCINPSAEEGVCVSFRAGRLYADIECFNSGEILAATSDGEGERRVWEVASRESEITKAAHLIRTFLSSRDS